MESENLEKFAKSIENKNTDEAEKLIQKILEDKKKDTGIKGIEELQKVGSDRAKELRKHGYDSIESLAQASEKELAKIPKVGKKSATKIIKSAQGQRKIEKEIEGYRHALEGIIQTLEEERLLTMPQKISEGKYPKNELKNIKEEMQARATHEFRPANERGFNRAWSDILEALS